MYSNPSGTGTAMNGPGGGLANMQAFEWSHRCDTGNGWYVAGRLARAISQDTAAPRGKSRMPKAARMRGAFTIGRA
jgi:hypothetical protein